jgi:toxin ParE1/3/4
VTGFILSPRAQGDLDAIWNYTAERWSENQAERYIRDIWQAIQDVTNNPTRARACDNIRSGYRRYAVGSHVLYFRLVGGQIDIVRILHQRMDFDRHL